MLVMEWKKVLYMVVLMNPELLVWGCKYMNLINTALCTSGRDLLRCTADWESVIISIH
jgi:hypothetical protein